MTIKGYETSGRERAELVSDAVGRQLTVRIRGEIDHHTAVNIRQQIDRMIFERRPERLVLDLSAISFMDSSGLGLIMGRYSVIKELGGELVVWNPSRETRSILTLAGMERMVRIEYPPDSPDGRAEGRSGRGTVRHPEGRGEVGRRGRPKGDTKGDGVRQTARSCERHITRKEKDA